MNYVILDEYFRWIQKYRQSKENDKAQASIYPPYCMMSTSSEALSMKNYILSWKAKI